MRAPSGMPAINGMIASEPRTDMFGLHQAKIAEGGQLDNRHGGKKRRDNDDKF